MKTLLTALMILFVFEAHGSATSCSSKENIATEYREWKKGFQKFILDYDNINAGERFATSKDSLKIVLDKMKVLSEKTLIPMPETTVVHARGLLAEIEEGRMARTTALPILKSSLKKLETSMDEMIAKAQWKNPACHIDVKISRNVGL
ncbi:MAG: hypothetical protein V4596_07640 [Bdellovibrionota bacterium]